MRLYHASLSLAVVIAAALSTDLSTAQAAPPTIEVPKEVTGEVGAFVVIRAKSDAKNVQFYHIDPGLSVFPSDLLTDPKATVVTSARDGTYRILVYAGNADGASIPVVIIVKIGKATAPPDPKEPPTTPAGKLYFVAIRPDGPAQIEFSRVMGLSQWAELAKLGHAYKDKTHSEAAALGIKLPAGATYGVAILRISADGKTSTQLAYAPFPSSAADVLNLPNLAK